MVNVAGYIKSKFMSAKSAIEQDMKGKKFVIDVAYNETINNEDKLCLRFKNVDSPMPLNQTNITILSAAYGDDTDAWINHKVMLNIVKVNYNGQMVDSIQLEPTN